jgi:hypothetical protein
MFLFAPEEFAWEYQLGLTVLAGAISAITAIFVFGPSSDATLQAFYDRVHPPGFWGPYGGGDSDVRWMLAAWVCGAGGLVGAIFAPGHLLLGHPGLAAVDVLAAAAGWGAALSLSRRVAR